MKQQKTIEGIAFFIQSDKLSGAEKRVAKLAQRLSSMGVKALIFTDAQTADVYRKAQYVDSARQKTLNLALEIEKTTSESPEKRTNSAEIGDGVATFVFC